MLRVARSLAATLAVVIGAGGVGTAASSALTTAVASSVPWVVTVGVPSRTLYPGLTATVPYSVRNASPERQLLHEVSAHLKNDGVDMFDSASSAYRPGCAAGWFAARVNVTPVSGGASLVNPAATVTGTVELEFRDAATGQGPCDDLALEIDVTAT